MYTLIFIALATPAYLGTYANIESCQNAIREIYLAKSNPPNQRLKEVEESIQIRMGMQKEYICIPSKKG